MQTLKISLKNSPEIHFIAEFLRPFTKRAYLVGGSVRDLLLGILLKDFDIELYDLSEEEFEKIMSKLGAKGFGKSFFVYKFKNYDLALARTENKIAPGHKGFSVAICNDEKLGASRRDFSLNAMMINIFSGELLDFYDGLNDLENKLLCHINADKFKEDSLRVLRAVNFVSRFGFDISKPTLSLMSELSIEDLSKDRINKELYKFFSGANLAKAYKYLQTLGLEKRLFGVEFRDDNFASLLENSRKFIADDGLFLYLYLNYFKFNVSEFFKKTKLKKEFIALVNQPFLLGELDKFKLGEVALSLQAPLKNWLGLWDEKRVSLAKKIGLYETCFKSQINSQTLINKGFEGKALGDELRRLKRLEMQNYLYNLKD